METIMSKHEEMQITSKPIVNNYDKLKIFGTSVDHKIWNKTIVHDVTNKKQRMNKCIYVKIGHSLGFSKITLPHKQKDNLVTLMIELSLILI